MGSTSLSLISNNPNPIAALAETGEWLYKSGFLNLSSPAQGFVVAHTCESLGITYMEFLQTYHIIMGRPCKRADASLAEFRTIHGGNHIVHEHTPDAVDVELIDKNKKSLRVRLTWEECKKEKWPYCTDKNGNPTNELKDNWSTPQMRLNMMFARVVSQAIRHLCPEVNAGIYTPEEMQDVIEGEVVSKTESPQKAAPKQFSEVMSSAVEESPKMVSPGPMIEPDVIDVPFEDKPAQVVEETATAAIQPEGVADSALRGPGGFALLEDATNILKIAHEIGLISNLEEKLKSLGANQPADLTFDQAKQILERLNDAKKQLKAAR